ncbi:MAG: hypothetical protein ACP5VF_02065 [Acidobacteriota bacterium]
MKDVRTIALVGLAALMVAVLACSKGPQPPKDIQYFPCDNMDGVQTPGLVTFDPSVSADGKGSLKITADQPTTVALFDVPFPGAEGSSLIYKAKVKTKDFGGDAYLQMVVHFANGGSLSTMDYQKAIGGTTGWVDMETSTVIQAGQKPDVVKLNLVANGQGTVWIDDVHLVRAPKPGS